MTTDISSAFASANRGPLTTIFTPPASCLSETTLVTYTTTSTGVSGAKATSIFTTTKVFVNHYSWGNQDCYPSTVGRVWGNGYYYSPGICPSGWTSACAEKTSVLGFATTLADDTNAVICCPENFGCVADGNGLNTGHQCATALISGQTLSSVWSAPSPTSGAPLQVPSSRPLAPYVVPEAMIAVCDAIPVLWKNTDIQILALLAAQTSSNTASTPSLLTTSPDPTTSTGLLTSSSDPVTSTSDSTVPSSSTVSTRSTVSTVSTNLVAPNVASLTSTPNSSPFESAAASPTPSAIKKTVSPGVRIAIGVSIPLVLISLLLGIFLFFRHRRRRTPHRQSIRHHVPSPTPTATTEWSTQSQSRLTFEYKESEFVFAEHLQVPAPLNLEIEPGMKEEAVELADTSHDRVREWARSVGTRSVSTRGSTRTTAPPVYVQRGVVDMSSLEDMPTSADLRAPEKTRCEENFKFDMRAQQMR